MKKLYEIIPEIKGDLVSKMPAILAGYGLSDFDSYGIGYPTDQNKNFCAVRFFHSDTDRVSKVDFTFTIHLQIISLEEAEQYKYFSALIEYLGTFNPQDYGYIQAGYETSLNDNFHASDGNIFIDVTMSGPPDECF
jgi:hypothetical protein